MSRVLAIGWDDADVQLLLAEVAGGVSQIEDYARHAWPDSLTIKESPPAAGEWLAGKIRDLGAEGARVVVALPREAVVIRRLSVPPAPDAELPDLVRFQASAKLSTPVDRLKIDFLPLPLDTEHPEEGRSVLVAAWERIKFDFVKTAVEAAGCELAAVTISPVAISYLVPQLARIAGCNPRAPLLIVMHDTRRIEIVIVEQSSVIFTHQSRLGDGQVEDDLMEVLQEIQRAVMAFEQNHPGVEIEQVLLLESGDEQDDLDIALEARFGAKLHRFTKNGMTEVLGRSVPAQAEWPRLMVPLGASLQGAAAPGIAGIDFVHPRKPPEKVNLRRQRLIRIGAAAAGVVLLVAIWMTWQIISLNGQIADLNADRVEAEKYIRAGEPVEEAAQRIADDWASRRFQPMAILQDLQASLGDRNRFYLTDYKASITSGSVLRIDANGRAVEGGDIEDIHFRLSEAEYGPKPQVPAVDPTKDPDYPILYTLELYPALEPAGQDE
jgi:Tfp pilus assembly PilM family ATPase